MTFIVAVQIAGSPASDRALATLISGAFVAARAGGPHAALGRAERGDGALVLVGGFLVKYVIMAADQA